MSTPSDRPPAPPEDSRPDAGLSGSNGPRGASAASQTLWRIATEIRLAASFLTILPVAVERADERGVAASLGWFPLVGFVIGVALAIVDRLLEPVFGPALGSVLVVLALVIVTGAVHLDGLADTADALGAGGNRARALEIMRDSRLGTFGVLALIFVLALKIFALAELAGGRRLLALYLAPALGRWAMVAVSFALDYLRAEGAGSALLSGGGPKNFVIASVSVAVGVAPVFSPAAFGACLLAVGLAISVRMLASRRLGGVTGDVLGAAGEIVETAVLVAMAS